MEKRSNRYTFGLGTVGRDMVYTIVSMYLIFYLTDVICLPTSTLWWVAMIILGARVFDAVNDPIMGVIVDNTRTRFGKFKPWIAIGAVSSAIFTILLFYKWNVTGAGYIVLFAVIYLMWGISYTAHDISYWSMLPALSRGQSERESIGSFARICSNVGLFAVVVGIVPITAKTGFFPFAVCVSVLMVLFLCITVFGVREGDFSYKNSQPTTLSGMATAIFKNDQLLFTAISMALFMIGYTTTTSFGLYFFKYAYGDEGMYSMFALVLGVSQIIALAVFPALGKRFERKTLYTLATGLVVLGYVIFFFAPTNTMLFIGIAGVLLFVGQAFISIMMMMFLADTVEYGHWKFGKRNESVTFSLQPFINKIGGAISSGIVSVVIILSGIKDANTAAEVTPGGLMMMKIAMLVLPLICIVAGYFIYRAKYIIDKPTYERIVKEIAERK